MLPATRPDAVSVGSKYYFTGKPCKHGHISKRLASNFGCYECHLERGRTDAAREYYSDYREKNRESISVRHKRWREENPHKVVEYNRKWRAENPEKIAEMDRSWNDRNRARKNAHRAMRRARLAQRTPPWADLEAIAFFYECRPEGCHVDHIIPLRGKNISGLHVEANLQWLPAEENLAKSNNWALNGT